MGHTQNYFLKPQLKEFPRTQSQFSEHNWFLPVYKNILTLYKYSLENVHQQDVPMLMCANLASNELMYFSMHTRFSILDSLQSLWQRRRENGLGILPRWGQAQPKPSLKIVELGVQWAVQFLTAVWQQEIHWDKPRLPVQHQTLSYLEIW